MPFVLLTFLVFPAPFFFLLSFLYIQKILDVDISLHTRIQEHGDTNGDIDVDFHIVLEKMRKLIIKHGSLEYVFFICNVR